MHTHIHTHRLTDKQHTQHDVFRLQTEEFALLYLCFYSDWLIFFFFFVKRPKFSFQRLCCCDVCVDHLHVGSGLRVCVCSSTAVSLCAADQKSTSAPNVRRDISRSRLQSRSEGMDITEGGGGGIWLLMRPAVCLIFLLSLKSTHTPTSPPCDGRTKHTIFCEK